MGPVWTIVVAAGSGTRFGQPKQYLPLGGRRVLDWSLVAARACSDGVVLVVAPDHADRPEPAADVVVAGGDTRSASVRAGLAAVPSDAEVVLVHDGARPLAPADLFTAVIAAVAEGSADAVVPGVPVVDTIRSRTRGVVDRSDLVIVQTPQGFTAAALRAAHADGAEGTDDASLVEARGGTVRVVPGAPTNLKITYPADLAVAEALLPTLAGSGSP
ncbi:MAG TPA: 2-C-methyl-D-erythritol 4-phosphate cytidylyltransferase [Acidimicrobiales bacterium]